MSAIPPAELTDAQREALASALEALRESLAEQLSATAAGARPVDLDEPIGRLSRVDAMQQQSMTQATRDGARVRLQRVEAALRRVEEEEYGDCLVCGEPIGFPRLEAQPETPLCIGCQSQRERVR